MDRRILELANALADAKRVYVLTGAGMGVASGLSTFRGAGGYWNNIEVERLASRSGFEIHPDITWDWYNMRIEHYLAAEPNAGHRALAEMESLVPHFSLATQNVDGLDDRAGTQNLLELHGNLRKAKCTGCAHTEPLDGPFDLDKIDHGCGGRLRPNVVWFGEDLNEITLHLAQQAGAKADLILVVGTSSLVYPAAATAKPYEPGAKVFDINPEPKVPWATHRIDLPQEEVLPAAVEMLRHLRENQNQASSGRTTGR